MLKLFRKTPAEKTFSIINGLLTLGGRELNAEQKFRLKAEALAFRSTLLYQLITTNTSDSMQQELVENAKDSDTINYLRAIIADRRILEEEINGWATSNIPIPTIAEMTKPKLTQM